MYNIYQQHKDIITSLFHSFDIDFILYDSQLSSHFSESAISRIKDNHNEKVDIFFREFEARDSPSKYLDFISATTEVSEWIAALLITTDDGHQVRRKYQVNKQLINNNSEFFVEHLQFDTSTIAFCLDEGFITSRTKALVTQTLDSDGVLLAKYQLLSFLHVRSMDSYYKFLVLCHHKNQIYLEVLHEPLNDLILDSSGDEQSLKHIKNMSDSEIANYILDIDPTVLAAVAADSSLPGSRSSDDQQSNTNDKCQSNNYSDESDDDTGNDEDFDALLGVSVLKTSTEMLNFQPEFTKSSPATLSLREYQHELAQRGVEGKNILICAPTSSGKTVVAIKIADEHMKSKKDGKVFLVVPTTVLVDQQFDIFHKYLGTPWKINKISGGSKSFSVPLSKQLADFDIFIVTCDILRNSLEDMEEPLESIGALSLIIFDECHHTDKDHSYNKVMDHYFKNKQLELPVPQVIGMTASTGTDKAKNVDSALKFLLSLCANLDCRIVSTVKINTEELNKNLPTPTNEIKTPGMRENDVFEICLWSLMDSIEAILEAIFSSKAISIGVPTDKYHDKYLGFVKGITNFHSSLLSEEERKGVKIIEIYLEYLYRALIVNHLFNFAYAIELLKEKIERKADCTCAIERRLRKLFEDFLDSSFADQDKNPSLECLKEEISKQIKADKRSKIIIFVKEVLYTRILESEIQKANMGFIQCKALVGTNKSSDQGGLSKSETDEIVSRFRRGIVNLLFATSVAEEGLDVEKCNLVMRYGHVTNEISMVQSRGRARASDSKYVVIVPQKLKWQVNKENINKIRETMMYQAITQFQNMSLKAIDIELFKLQEKRLALRAAGSSFVDTVVKPVTSSSLWRLHCSKCESPICSSQDIRVAHGSSYIIVNKNAYPKLPMKNNGLNNYTVVCVKCELQIGHVTKVDGVSVPTIKIQQCLLRSDTETIKRKKWKESPFSVPVVTGSDMLACNSELYTLL